MFRVCDQPHPVLVGAMVKHCTEAHIDEAYEGMKVGGSCRGAGTGAGQMQGV